MFSFGKRTITTVLIVFLVLGIIGWAWKQRESLPFITKAFHITAMPLELAGSRAMMTVHTGIDVIDVAWKKRVEWEELENKVAALEAEKNRWEETKAENQRLQGLLDYRKANPQYRLMVASVISRNFGTWSNTIIIDRGKNDGVQPFMPIITPKGVVGFVAEVYPYSSRVQLILDPRSSVGAVVQRPESRVVSIIRGNGNNPLEPQFINIPREADILDGDVLVTSGLGGVYPKGLIVGTVKAVYEDENNFMKAAIVTPAVDFSRLEEVFVLLHAEDTLPNFPEQAILVPQSKRDQLLGIQNTKEGKKENQKEEDKKE